MIERFKEICSKYNGKFVASDWNAIVFQNKNELEGKKVECMVCLDKSGKLGAEEKTYSIIGGCSGYMWEEETLIRLLDRYGFTRKNDGQTDIWEML